MFEYSTLSFERVTNWIDLTLLFMKSLVKIVECCIETLQRMLNMYHKKWSLPEVSQQAGPHWFCWKNSPRPRASWLCKLQQISNHNLFLGHNLKNRGQNHSEFVFVVVVVLWEVRRLSKIVAKRHNGLVRALGAYYSEKKRPFWKELSLALTAWLSKWLYL